MTTNPKCNPCIPDDGNDCELCLEEQRMKTAPNPIPDSISRHSTDQFLCCNEVHNAIIAAAITRDREKRYGKELAIIMVEDPCDPCHSDCARTACDRVKCETYQKNLKRYLNLRVHDEKVREEAIKKEREQNAKIIRELRNALIISANNAYERKSIVNEIKPERMFYNELQFQFLVEGALKESDDFKPDYESKEPLKWRRDADNESRNEKKPKKRG